MSNKERKIRKGAIALEMSDREKTLLTDYQKRREIAHHHKSRIGLLLLATEGYSHNYIARAEQTTVNRVKFWRINWERGKDALKKYELGELGHGVKRPRVVKRDAKTARRCAPSRCAPSHKREREKPDSCISERSPE